jgi:hypothetical protein
MSCSRSTSKFSISAIRSGISQATNQAANLAGISTKKATTWANKNPGQAALAGGTLYATGLTCSTTTSDVRFKKTPTAT